MDALWADMQIGIVVELVIIIIYNLSGTARIKNGEFSLDGNTFSLAKNNGGNHLHGGLCGFDKRVWSYSVTKDTDKASVEYTYISKDKEENYPGNVQVKHIMESYYISEIY